MVSTPRSLSAEPALAEMNERLGVTFLFSTHDEKLMARVGHVLHLVDGALPS